MWIAGLDIRKETWTIVKQSETTPPVSLAYLLYDNMGNMNMLTIIMH